MTKHFDYVIKKLKNIRGEGNQASPIGFIHERFLFLQLWWLHVKRKRRPQNY